MFRSPSSLLPLLFLLMGLLSFLACSVFQRERDQHALRLIENDIEILTHARRMLDTVYSGGRRHPNIIRGVQRSRRGDRLSRDMLPGMLNMAQDYLKKMPPLHADLPETRDFIRDREALLGARNARASIPIYKRLRRDIDLSLLALRQRHDALALSRKSGPMLRVGHKPGAPAVGL